ncbi:hypothetical protein MATL_G00231310 [Megalops atlanticus]|uniref:Endothelin-like toxin domain-containing protein n=1 Tax=Megalops atlanticus TaxID=7932 RepID=A0A9D3PI20_MEGAT|nr:hypothetical protein MATL_G00231310 [Megalops atlanticus]
MALSLCTLLALCITLCVLLPDGSGLPVSGQPNPSEAPSNLPRVRTKRCSCNNWLDKECIYFCHLDIIWVNTPSKTIPYGLGSPLSRKRRSTGRCECSSSSDQTCTSFCHHSTENPEMVVVNPLSQSMDHTKRSSATFLTFLRDVVRANTRAIRQGVSPRKKRSEAHGPQEAHSW